MVKILSMNVHSAISIDIQYIDRSELINRLYAILYHYLDSFMDIVLVILAFYKLSNCTLRMAFVVFIWASTYAM